MASHAIRRKLVVCGDGVCGKTCLLVVFKDNEFPETYIPTVFETYVTDIQLQNGPTVELGLWDTAGQDDYERLRPLSYPGTDVILVCFSIDMPSSLENVREKWVPEVQHYLPRVPFILVGNKADLRDDDYTKRELARNGERPVSFEDGQRMADSIGAVGYFETSAIENKGVQEVFEAATRISLQKRRRPGGNGRSGFSCEVL